MAHAPDEMVEVFHTDSTDEARRVLDTLLVPAGIEGRIHDRVDHALPAPVSQSGDVAIAVQWRDMERAVAILKEAEEDGYIDRTEAGASSSPILV